MLKRRVLIGLAVLVVLFAAVEMTGRWRITDGSRERVQQCPEGEQFHVRDGRRLGFRRVGRPGGERVFFFHGALGSRFDWPLGMPAQADLVAIERPGYGCSDPQAERTLRNWVEDIEDVSAALRWRSFRVVGWSAGAPHALAVAAAFPGRVTRVDLIGAVAPPQRLTALGTFVKWLPGISYLYATRLRTSQQRNPQEFQAEFTRRLGPVDRAEFMRVEEAQRRTQSEALRESALGLLEDFRILGREWGFDVHRIESPVRLWHGTEDSLAPIVEARNLAGQISRAEFIAKPGQGHYLIYQNEPDILK